MKQKLLNQAEMLYQAGFATGEIQKNLPECLIQALVSAVCGKPSST